MSGTVNGAVTFNMGKHYEERLVQALIVDNKFAEQMTEILNVDYFGLEHLREIAKILFGYYEKYRTFPSVGLLSTMLLDQKNSEVLREKYATYLDHIKKEPLNGDLEYIKENSLEFCRKRCVMLSLEKILEFAENRKYNEIVPEIQKALLAGSEKDMGHSFLEDFEARMQRIAYKPIPTPWELINKLIKGGLGGGKLGCICAVSGVGKSHALVEMGVAAAQAGFTVAHYTFELSECDTGNRYDSRIANIGIDNLIDHKDFVLRKVQSVPGKIVIKSYPTKSASVATIRNHLHKLKMKGVVPDILIIDYADLMRSRRAYDQRRMEEESVYEELRGLAMELDIPIWTAAQANRSGMDAEVITLKEIAECFAKAMICDLFLTLNRKKDGSDYSTVGNLFVAKSRMGRDGVKFPMVIDTTMSKIEVLDPGAFTEDDEDDRETRMKRKLKEMMLSKDKKQADNIDKGSAN